MLGIVKEVPAALLDMRFCSNIQAIQVPEEEVVVIKDEKGIDILDKEFSYVPARKQLK